MLVIALTAIAACSGSDDQDASPTTQPPEPTAARDSASPTTTTTVPAPTTSTSIIQVSTTGTPPTIQPVPTTELPSTTTSQGPEGMVVTIGDLFFRPGSLTVTRGETVTWQHEGDFPHTTTAGVPGSRTNEWHSGTMTPGELFSVTFDTAGTFAYFCAIHPNDIRATITVADG